MSKCIWYVNVYEYLFRAWVYPSTGLLSPNDCGDQSFSRNDEENGGISTCTNLSKAKLNANL